MKSITMLVLSLVTLGLSQNASAGYDHSLFARFKTPKNLTCQQSFSTSVGYSLNISYSGTLVASVPKENRQLVSAIADCNAAIIQASEGGNMIYVNINDGTVLPDDGFFVHQ